MKKTSVIIIEDNEDMRYGLEILLDGSKNYFCLGAFPSILPHLETILERKPEIILMDLDLPGINGIEGTKRIKSELPKTEVLIITVFENSDYVFEALKAGACGYLTKNMSQNQLINSLDDLMNGGAPMSANIARMVVASFQKTRHGNPLTEKESHILSMLSQGKSIKTVAQQEDISPNTVKFHLKNIYLKLQVTNKEEALELAKNKNWI